MTSSIAMFAIQSRLQKVHLCYNAMSYANTRQNVHRMTAFECRMTYIVLHFTSYHAPQYQNVTTECRPYKAWKSNFPRFGIFPYFSEIFRNFPGNFPEIFRNIIFRKIYITSNRSWFGQCSNTVAFDIFLAFSPLAHCSKGLTRPFCRQLVMSWLVAAATL